MLMSELVGAALPSQKSGVNLAWLRVSFRLSAPQARRPTRGIAHFQTQRLRFLLLTPSPGSSDTPIRRRCENAREAVQDRQVVQGLGKPAVIRALFSISRSMEAVNTRLSRGCTKEIARVLAGPLRTLLSLNSPRLSRV
jgi:hypothetical protein